MMKPNEPSAAFDPSLKPQFSKQAFRKSDGDIGNSRELFYCLIHISEHYAALPRIHHFLSGQLAHINKNFASRYTAKFSAQHLQQLLKAVETDAQTPLSGTSVCGFLTHYAPIFLTELSWLAQITQTATSDNPLAVEMLALYQRLTKAEHSIAGNRRIYLGHALAAGANLPGIHTQAFANYPEILDDCFDFAAIQLGFRQFPRVFFAEILGFTLAYCQASEITEGFFDQTNKAAKLSDFFSERAQRRRQEIPALTTIIQAYFAEHPEVNNELWQRLQNGFWLYQTQNAVCRRAVSNALQLTLSPRQAMHKLLQGLIPNAIGHHGKIRIGGKTIDEWFKEQPFKSETFLASLLHTPYVDRAKPEQSKLLKLFEFNGPMFGVLDDHAKAIVKDWLLTELDPESLERQKNIQSTIRARSHKYGLQKISHEPEKPAGLFELSENYLSASQGINFSALSSRDLYFYLVNLDLYPEVLATAKQKVARWLTWTQWLTRLPVKIYSHANFERYIHTIFQHEADTYRPLIAAPKLGKNVYIWGIEQFAPAILADGCWLQGAHQLDFSPNAAVGAFLQKIYADEAGNGIYDQNHPHIYRQLLDSVDLKLPPVHSKAFVNHPGFLASAFDIPVFLMGIAEFPNTFLPELLGVNMAIELSGLGKVYPRLSEELSYYGINPAIVDVHTSIDNLATGHSALAIRAIQLYLDDVLTGQGEIARQSHWRRIYTGFCTLKFVSRRFRLALSKQYLAKAATAA